MYDKGNEHCGRARVRSVGVIVAVRQHAARGRIKRLVRRSKLSLRNRTTLFTYNIEGVFVFNATAHPQRMIVRFAVSIPLSNPVSAYAAAQESAKIARKWFFRLLIIKSEFIRFACDDRRKWLFRLIIVKSRSSGFIRFACELGSLIAFSHSDHCCDR